MNLFERKIRSSNHSITDAECEEIKDRFKVDDIRSDKITAGTAFWPQFAFSHMAFNSKKGGNGEMFNLYDFHDDGSGIYPAVGTSSLLLDNDGRFRFASENGIERLPVVTWTNPEGSAAGGELAADMDRANENTVLTAFHRMACKHHNKRMDVHGNYGLAKSETIASMNQISLNEATVITGIEGSDILNQVKVKDFHKSLEFNFQASRPPHALMPETVHDNHLFAKGIMVDVSTLFDGSTMARGMNLGVTAAMTDIPPVRGEKSIINRTVDRHNELRLASFDDLCKAYRLPMNIDMENCPIWVGMLRESEMFGDGILGPVGARAYADGVAGTLLWARDQHQGLWHPRWDGAPVATADILDYALS